MSTLGMEDTGVPTLIDTKEPIHDDKIIHPLLAKGNTPDAVARRLPCATHSSFGRKLLQGREFSPTCHVSAWLLVNTQQIFVVSNLA